MIEKKTVYVVNGGLFDTYADAQKAVRRMGQEALRKELTDFISDSPSVETANCSELAYELLDAFDIKPKRLTK